MNLSKEEIEKAKDILNNYKFLFSKNIKENTDTYICNYYTKIFRDNIEILLQYIQELEISNKELDKENNRLEKIEFEKDMKDKIIDEMAIEIASSDNYDTFCKEVYPNNSCEVNGIPCWDCVKQYFEKKVEEK